MFVVVVWFCRSCSLAFLISAYLINLMHLFLLHWVICFGGYLFVHTPVFFNNTWIFCVFLSVPHLVDKYTKIVDERGRNLMCDRTLPSRLVSVKLEFFFHIIETKYELCCKILCEELSLFSIFCFTITFGCYEVEKELDCAKHGYWLPIKLVFVRLTTH